MFSRAPAAVALDGPGHPLDPSIEAWTQPSSWRKTGGTEIMHIFMKVRGGKIKGKERLR